MTLHDGVDDRALLDRIVRKLPPRRYRLDDYQRWFPKTADALLRYLKDFRPLPRRDEQPACGPDRGTFGLVVVPWVCTPVPWYSIMLAIGLRRRGRPVVLLWDDTGFAESRLTEQQRVLAATLPHVEQFLPVMRLTDVVPARPRPDDEGLIESLSHQNLVWRLRGAAPGDTDQRVAADIRASLTRSLPFIRAALAATDLECLVTPGGVYGTSGLFLRVARERGIRAATFDADRHILQVCSDGVAAQNGDLARAFEALWGSGEMPRRRAVELAREEFQRRVQGRDGYGFQMVPARVDGRADGEIAALIPLNVEWDSAALGRHVHFSDTVDWVTSTVSTVLGEDAGTVVVRQHPSERRPLQRSNLDLASALRDRFDGERRLRFVPADEPTNTYDLLRSARLVLPFVSTIGIEAAAIGKPVVVSGAAYYTDLGFVHSAASRDEYFALLRRGLRGDLAPLPDQSERAWTCYYLAAVQNRIETCFTPHPDDFWKWCRRAPDVLFSDPDVSDVLEAIDRDVPVSLLRHRRTVSQGHR